MSYREDTSERLRLWIVVVGYFHHNGTPVIHCQQVWARSAKSASELAVTSDAVISNAIDHDRSGISVAKIVGVEDLIALEAAGAPPTARVLEEVEENDPDRYR